MDFWITGIDGFVGRHLARLLVAQGHKVGGTVLPSLSPLAPFEEGEGIGPLLPCDIRDRDMVRSVWHQTHPKHVIHLAAQAFVPRSWQDPHETFQINLEGTLNILEAMRELELGDQRLVFISSATVYGIIDPARLPIDETHPVAPRDPYAVSKLAAEQLCLAYARKGMLEATVLRSFNHIGPGQRESFVASAFARQVALMEVGRALPVLRVGNLEPERDLTDVRDVVEAYRLVAVRGANQAIYNVGSGRSQPIAEIVDILKEASTVDFEIEIDAQRCRPSENPVLRCDCSRLHEATGWEAKIPFRQSVQDILQWWREHLDAQP